MIRILGVALGTRNVESGKNNQLDRGLASARYILDPYHLNPKCPDRKFLNLNYTP